MSTAVVAASKTADPSKGEGPGFLRAFAIRHTPKRLVWLRAGCFPIWRLLAGEGRRVVLIQVKAESRQLRFTDIGPAFGSGHAPAPLPVRAFPRGAGVHIGTDFP